MEAQGAQPPRGVTLDERGRWALPCQIVTTDQHDQVSLILAGGVDHDFCPGATDRTILALLLADDQSPARCEALGISREDYESILYELADQAPEQPPGPADYGIPTLNPAYQATIADLYNLRRWGARARSAEHRGTFHFYTDDAKFVGLLNAPERLPATGAAAAVECNFTISAEVPSIVALHRIYQKRWLSSQWQQSGVRLFVDMNVEPRWMETNLIGVPDGWKAYMCRGYARNPEQLSVAYNAARTRAGGEILYAVYGGGAPIKAICEDRGWHYLEEDATAARAANGTERTPVGGPVLSAQG